MVPQISKETALQVKDNCCEMKLRSVKPKLSHSAGDINISNDISNYTWRCRQLEDNILSMDHLRQYGESHKSDETSVMQPKLTCTYPDS